MTIGIILHPYGEDKPSGLGRYAYELTKALLEIDKENKYIIYTKSKASLDLKGENFKVVSLGFGKLWRDIGFLFAKKSDVYIFVTPTLPLFYKLKRTIVITHDFPYHYVKAENLKQYIFSKILHYFHKLSLNKADKVVAISEYTKNEDMKLFGVNSAKIAIIYNGFRDICKIPPKNLAIPKPYFFTIGAVKERKNTLNIVKAFKEFKKNNLPHKLVIAGKTGNKYSEKVFEYIGKNNLKDDIIFFGHANDAELSSLYRNAEALVFPSLIESFGFPVLEAGACGTPTITSRGQGSAEVTGGAGILVDPLNVDEIKSAMIKISNDKEFRRKLSEKSSERVKEFSWQKTAKSFLQLIQHVR
ncbi:MAG: glycosyltransferase family 1 protein [Candidatus Pacebacteria bacterium]|jgi:glycosyltransferase involved in cell wall biosynthesis|nr:glycosyltransferase family 1 protein [Candidatus Paceibacterota bacterium]|tara:strand:- start:5497 stop:6570 length:1074 start_codon:yes stop_codon:yes gene_type:complete